MKNFIGEGRKTFALAGPIVLSQLGHIMLGVTDSVMIGQVGTVPLAASAFAFSIISIFLVFGLATTSCVSTLVAQAKGLGKNKQCGIILQHGAVIGTIVSILIAVFLTFFSEYLYLFKQDAEVLREAEGYFVVFSWSLVPALIFAAFRHYSEGLSHTLLPMVIMISSIAFNVFFNWVFIYGNLGAPAMGLFGAGVGTLIVRFLMMIAIIMYVFKGTFFKQYLPDSWGFPNLKSLYMHLLSIGIPTGFLALFEVAAFAAAAIMVGWFGAEALASHQIAINLATITFMVILGISYATNIRVGQTIGRLDIGAVRRVGFGSIGLMAIVMTCFATVLFLGRKLFPTFYIDDPNVIKLATDFIIVAALFQISDGIQGVGVGALRGLTDVRVPAAVTFLAYWIISLPLGHWIAFKQGVGPIGIWLGLLFGLTISAFLLTYRYHMKTRPENADDIETSISEPLESL